KMLPKIEYEICTVGITKNPIKTAGGLTLVPDISLDEFNQDDASALLMIGADTWVKEEHKKMLDIASSLLDKGVVVAAICGATLGLANIGALDNRNHTSNALFFLKGLSQTYKGDNYYKEDVAVMDKNLITASSAGSLLWAYYILESLNIYSKDTLRAWYNYFSLGEAKYFQELMQTLQ
ncbi:MAG: DJ-1/PfpI family protein, partial [Clostridiales bacterium]